MEQRAELSFGVIIMLSRKAAHYVSSVSLGLFLSGTVASFDIFLGS